MIQVSRKIGSKPKHPAVPGGEQEALGRSFQNEPSRKMNTSPLFLGSQNLQKASLLSELDGGDNTGKLIRGTRHSQKVVEGSSVADHGLAQ